MNTQGNYPDIVVSLGTDHHRFDRLVDWLDEWLQATPHPPTCLVQHGASRVPSFAQGVPRMPREELLELYRHARVVVVQGGPGSILDAREVGKLPIAVPRRPELHEVVDGHQIEFTRTMAAHGEAVMEESKPGLIGRIEAGLREPQTLCTEPRHSGAPEASLRLGSAVEQMEKLPTGPLSLRRIRQLIVH